MMGSGPRNLEQEGRRLVERLGGRWSTGGGMCRCPAHDDRTPSLSVRPGRKRLLLHCFAGCDASAILRLLAGDGLLETRIPLADCGPGRTDERRIAAALRLWNDARSIANTPAEAYLRSRGLADASAQLRYHPRTPLGAAPFTRFLPALIAAVRDDSGLVAVHRTFLDSEGSGLAPLEAPRRGLGRFGSGTVRLGGSSARLGLAEGIETALSASLLFGLPCWATLGTERFARIGIPAQVRELHLFIDHDSGGRRAERLAREAFADVPLIETHVPDQPGDDWNDVLRASSRGREARGERAGVG